uniref:NAD(P)/FAD-dependent oxidoreductase n=1 Tax=Flavobacterium sp. TaxID=239 RepID=UPI00404B373F
MKDFIIVGGGLAGLHFANQCLLNQKSFILIDQMTTSASKVAAGVYNPVILKRFTLSWNANHQVNLFNEIYRDLAKELQVEFDCKLPVLRRIFDIEEQNNWFLASDKPQLSSFLKTPLIEKHIVGVKSYKGFGEIQNTGYVDTNLLIHSFIDYLVKLDLLLIDIFNHDDLMVQTDFVSYKNIVAKHIVFAEGFNLQLNPYFNCLPLLGSKGELITVEVPDLNLDFILKGNVFVIPLGNHLFRVGSTYTWSDLDINPTSEGLDYLVNEFKNLVDLPFKVVKHEAGIRPSSRDRRPMIGTHPKYANLHVINGLGTRGVLIAPDMSKELFEHIVNGKPINKEASIDRFKKIEW